MNISYELHFLLAGWSLITGCLLGMIYEWFCLLHRIHPKLIWLIFLEDLLFCLCCTGGMQLLFFNLSYGQMRLYAFAGVALGFAGWYFTLGKLFRRAVSRLYRFLHPRFIYLRGVLYTLREQNGCRRAARAGYGIGKKIRRDTHVAQS